MLPFMVFALAAAPTAVPVDAVLAAYRAAWDRADGGALASLFTADGELNSAAGSAVGRAAIGQFYAGAFAAGTAGGTLTVRVDGSHAVAPAVIAGRGAARIAAAGSSVCVRFFAVLRREGGVWRIADFSEVALACAAVDL